MASCHFVLLALVFEGACAVACASPSNDEKPALAEWNAEAYFNGLHLQVSDGELFWHDGANIAHVSTTGGTASPLYQDGCVIDFAVDAENLYAGTCVNGVRSLVALSRGNGATTALVDYGGFDITLSGNRLVYADQGELVAFSLTSRARQAIPPSTLAVDGTVHTVLFGGPVLTSGTRIVTQDHDCCADTGYYALSVDPITGEALSLGKGNPIFADDRHIAIIKFNDPDGGTDVTVDVMTSLGTDRVTLFSEPDGALGAVAIQGEWAYWATDIEPASIKRAPILGGPPELVVTGRPPIHALAVDDAAIYWAESSDQHKMRLMKQLL